MAERERAYQRLLESLPGTFVWTGDVTGQVTYVNQAFLEFTGRTIDEIRHGDLSIKLVLDRADMARGDVRVEVRVRVEHPADPGQILRAGL